MLTLRARELDERLDQIAKTFVFGQDERLVSNDPQYSVQVLQIVIDTPSSSSPLGIELAEIDRRGLVAVTGVTGAAARTSLQVGDIVAAVVLGEYVRFQTSGYDATIKAIEQARKGTTQEVILEINRLVESAVVQ
ncbi:hypothetical protein MHU86_17827 [Fragilaria crotonensis]|nr:hypothetical protein MHU86_17827 [Fragilaria crotonensis]